MSVATVFSRITCLTRWPVESQQHARSNALLAATELARRRAEREEVEQFLAAQDEDSVRPVPARVARG